MRFTSVTHKKYLNNHHHPNSKSKISKMLRNTDTEKYLKCNEHRLDQCGKTNKKVPNTIVRAINV